MVQMYDQSGAEPNLIRNSSDESLLTQPAQREAGLGSPLASKVKTRQFPSVSKVVTEDPIASKLKQYAQQSPSSTRAHTYRDWQSPNQPAQESPQQPSQPQPQPPHQYAYQPPPHQAHQQPSQPQPPPQQPQPPYGQGVHGSAIRNKVSTKKDPFTILRYVSRHSR